MNNSSPVDPKSRRLKKLFGDYPNTIETLKDPMLPDRWPTHPFFKGFPTVARKASGELKRGESLELDEALSVRHEENQKLKRRLVLERRLREEEDILVRSKTNELKVQIETIRQEIIEATSENVKLAREIDIARVQVESEPSLYELFFLDRIIEFIKDFRKKIESASLWLEAANKRASKKNLWGQNYKKKRGAYLLSGEHYLTRSAA